MLLVTCDHHRGDGGIFCAIKVKRNRAGLGIRYILRHDRIQLYYEDQCEWIEEGEKYLLVGTLERWYEPSSIKTDTGNDKKSSSSSNVTRLQCVRVRDLHTMRGLQYHLKDILRLLDWYLLDLDSDI